MSTVMSVEWLTMLLPVIVPVVVAVAKMLVPKIPKMALPVLAIVGGAAIEMVGYYAGLSQGNAILGAVLGAAGIGLREVVDQIKRAVSPA